MTTKDAAIMLILESRTEDTWIQQVLDKLTRDSPAAERAGVQKRLELFRQEAEAKRVLQRSW